VSHSKDTGPSGDFRWLLLLWFLGIIGGIVTADMWVRRNNDLIWPILLGLCTSVLGIGYSIVIKNPFRFLLAGLGGAGLGLLVRGYLAM